MYTTFILDGENVWREVLICDGTEVFSNGQIRFNASDTVIAIYYTNELYKSVDGYNWYIVNAKESIVDNPALVQSVSLLSQKQEEENLSRMEESIDLDYRVSCMELGL